jgi:acyl carrier protein
MDPTLENLISIIESQTGIQRYDLLPETTFEEIGVDSLDHAELILTCEDAFEIEIPEAEACACITIGTLRDTIATLQLSHA